MRRLEDGPREGRWLLPVAVAVLVLLAAFAVLSYRNALRTLTEERRAEAQRVADSLAGSLATKDPDVGRLPRVPTTALIAVVDADGRLLSHRGELPERGLLDVVDGRLPEGPASLGPSRSEPVVVAFLPLDDRHGEGRVLRVDLPATTLAAHGAAVEILTWVVLGAALLSAVWLTLFLRRLLGPYEELLDRARELRTETSTDEDDESFLVRVVERAVGDLTRSGAGDLEVLERTLAPSVESGLMLLDPEGRILVVNAAGLALLQAPPPAPRESLEVMLADHPELAGLLEEAIGAERSVQRRECRLGPSAAGRSLGVTVTPLRPPPGGLRGFLVLFADLTEAHRADAEERLAESLAQLGELAAGVAHELRNGLGTVKGYVALLDRRVSEPEAREWLDEVDRETRHLERVVRDFLAFARPGTVRPESIDLERLLGSLAARPGPLPVELELAPPPLTPHALRGDPELLQRALSNLVDNAVEASEGTGARRVAILTRWTDDGLEIAVRDRGPGLPDAVRERLFQPFVSERPGGVGLGLSLAHRIVRLHAGRLRLDDRPGGGVEAVVSFPRDVLVGGRANTTEERPWYCPFRPSGQRAPGDRMEGTRWDQERPLDASPRSSHSP